MGAWLRPISARATAEISEEERRYEDGVDPRVLDIMTIQFMKPVPHAHQQENHLIDDSFYWAKNGVATWRQLGDGIENPAGPLWLNGSSSSNGLNDRVPEAALAGMGRSLFLIRPDSLTISTASEGGDFGPSRRRVRAKFSLCSHDYTLAITDPVVERESLAGENGERVLKGAIVCVSLAEVFHGHAYKVAAAVISQQRAEAASRG